jgi:glucosamine--fructose-6-phosphate aminotransferase (isomerizing)
MNTFLEEICSQGKALQRTLAYLTAEDEAVFVPIQNGVHNGKISRFIFTGMGSSYFSSYVPLYMLKQHGFDVEMLEAGEFLLHGFPEKNQRAFEHTCIILISQSGESGEIVELLQKLNVMKLKPLTIGITNTSQSYLATHSDVQLYLNAGKEETVTSKTYVCSILTLYFLAKALMTQQMSLRSDLRDIDEIIQQISHLFQSNPSCASLENLMQPIHSVNTLFGNDYNFIQILARGPSLSTAHQAALNFKEIVKITSEASSLSTFRHGGIECLTEQSKLIIISSSDKDHQVDNRFIRNLIEKWRFGALFYLTTQTVGLIDEAILTHPNIIIYSIDIRNSFLVSIFEIAVIQLMIYHTAVQRALTPGSFKFTQKITRGL